MLRRVIAACLFGLGISVVATVPATMSAEGVRIPTDPKAAASVEVVQALIRQEVDRLEKALPDRVAEGIDKYYKNKQSQTQTQTQTQTVIRKTVVHIHRHYYPRYWWCPPPPPWFAEY
jgi:hypothetical protein